MTTDKLASYPHYPRDYAADTQLLDLAEDGAYRRLLDYQWLHREIPDSPRDLAKVWGVSVVRAKRLWARLQGYFPPPEDNPTGPRLNRRLERERAAALERMETASENGRRRWKGTSGNERSAAARHAAEVRWKDRDASGMQADMREGHASLCEQNASGDASGMRASVSVSVSGTSSSDEEEGKRAPARAAPPPRTPGGAEPTPPERLPAAYQPDYLGLMRGSHRPDALRREVETLLAGKHPTVSGVQPEDVGVALRELALAGAPANKLAVFVRVARDRRLEAPLAPPPRGETREARIARLQAEARAEEAATR